MKAKTLTIFIERNAGDVYDFVQNPENMPKWAKTFCKSIKRTGEDWVLMTPQGPARLKITERNDLGVLDHYLTPAPGVDLLVPMRVVPNGRGSEVIFTLFQLPMIPDENFAKDIIKVRTDLRTLKGVMESDR